MTTPSSRNAAELAAVLRTACDFSVMTDDEVAAVLEEGDDYDQMARAALDWFARRSTETPWTPGKCADGYCAGQPACPRGTCKRAQRPTESPRRTGESS